MKNPRALLIAVGALAFIVGGFLFVRGPKPIIEIKGETLSDLGPFPIINTWLTGVMVVVVVSVFFYLGARKLSLVPTGFQNFVEWVTETLYDICIATAGEKHGRRFFPVAATLFVFIWFANWMALTPIFNSFGAIEKVDAHHFHEEAHVLDKAGGIGIIMPFSLFGDGALVEFEPDESRIEELEEQKKEAESHGNAEEAVADIEHEIEEVRGEAIVEELHDKELVPENITEIDAALDYLDEDGKQLGIILPYFRSMNTDLNSPLSLAIVSVIFIEFWGITALGFFKYGGKFLNFTSPIAFFVGFLEIIAEMARIISFTFRLFGNMLAGEILLLVMTFLAPFLVALPFYGLETFVGIIQAFVFFILTIAFGALATAEHGEHDGHAEHPGDDHPLIDAEYGSRTVEPAT